MKELKLIKHIKEFGLEDTLSKFKLKCKEYPNKIIIKYDQIESDLSILEVQEARGIILEKDTWKVLSLGFTKFFNSAETHAAKIDWSTARILEKMDGTLITLYVDPKTGWCVGTTGTAEGEGEVNNKFGTTFGDLFRTTYTNQGSLWGNLSSRFIYVFELCTPYNIVVKPHQTSSAILLTIRDVETLEEKPREFVEFVGKLIKCPVVKEFDLNTKDVDGLIKTFEGMPYTEEGYVVVDNNFSRIKIKNPSYLACHHLKNKTAEHHIMTIIKSNEVEEYVSTFVERKEEVLSLKNNYDVLKKKLHGVWEELKNHLPHNTSKEEEKRYALKVFEAVEKEGIKNFSGLYFSLKNGKVETIDDFINEYDNKKLYNLL